MNEIKIGQWARYTFNEKYIISKIKKLAFFIKLDNLYAIYMTNGDTAGVRNIIKIADNLEDLLEVGDIVHYTIPLLTKPIEYIIESDNALKWIQQKLISNVYKITAIELHENRVKQVIRNERD